MIRFRIEFEHALWEVKENPAFRYSFFAGAGFTAALFFFVLNLAFGQGWAVGVGWLLLGVAGFSSLRGRRYAAEQAAARESEEADEAQAGNQS